MRTLQRWRQTQRKMGRVSEVEHYLSGPRQLGNKWKRRCPLNSCRNVYAVWTRHCCPSAHSSARGDTLNAEMHLRPALRFVKLNRWKITAVPLKNTLTSNHIVASRYMAVVRDLIPSTHFHKVNEQKKCDQRLCWKRDGEGRRRNRRHLCLTHPVTLFRLNSVLKSPSIRITAGSQADTNY